MHTHPEFSGKFFVEFSWFPKFLKSCTAKLSGKVLFLFKKIFKIFKVSILTLLHNKYLFMFIYHNRLQPTGYKSTCLFQTCTYVILFLCVVRIYHCYSIILSHVHILRKYNYNHTLIFSVFYLSWFTTCVNALHLGKVYKHKVATYLPWNSFYCVASI